MEVRTYPLLRPFWNVWETPLKSVPLQTPWRQRSDQGGRKQLGSRPTAPLTLASLLTHSFMCVLSRASQIWSSEYWLKGSRFDLERNTEKCLRDPACTHGTAKAAGVKVETGTGKELTPLGSQRAHPLSSQGWTLMPAPGRTILENRISSL